MFIRDAELEYDKKEGLAIKNQDVAALPLACDYFNFMFGTGTGG